jgi:hypothetical protein
MDAKQTLIRVPWGKVGVLIGMLIKSAKGGINREEAEELLEQLADIIIHLSVSVK